MYPPQSPLDVRPLLSPPTPTTSTSTSTTSLVANTFIGHGLQIFFPLSISLSLSLSLAVSPVSSLISSSFRPLSRARAFASVQQQTVKGILSIVPFSSSKKDGQASSYNIPIPYPPFPPCTIIRRNERERERTSYHVARPRQKASNSSTLVTYRKSFLSFWKKKSKKYDSTTTQFPQPFL